MWVDLCNSFSVNQGFKIIFRIKEYHLDHYTFQSKFIFLKLSDTKNLNSVGQCRRGSTRESKYIVPRARSLHRKWPCTSLTLGDDMSHTKSYLIDRYFSVHLTANIGDVKLSTNVVYGRNGLRGDDSSLPVCSVSCIVQLITVYYY